MTLARGMNMPATEIRARLYPATRGCLDLVMGDRNVGHLCEGTVGAQTISVEDGRPEDEGLPAGTRIVVGDEVAVLPAARGPGPLHWPEPPGPTPTAYAAFQWKGTWAVLVFTCACGAGVEAAGEFLYHFECPFCRTYYRIHDRVSLHIEAP